MSKNIEPNYRFIFSIKEALEYFEKLKEETGNPYWTKDVEPARSIRRTSVYLYGSPGNETCILLYQKPPVHHLLGFFYKLKIKRITGWLDNILQETFVQMFSDEYLHQLLIEIHDVNEQEKIMALKESSHNIEKNRGFDYFMYDFPQIEINDELEPNNDLEV